MTISPTDATPAPFAPGKPRSLPKRGAAIPRCGFTLVEVLLVVAIIGILSVVSMPYLVHSIRGNRLRSAARTVVSAGRYARSMALLRQKEVRLTFDLAHATVAIQGAAPPPAAAAPDTNAPPAIDLDAGSGTVVLRDEMPSPSRAPAGGSGTEVDITRTLDNVSIVDVEFGDTNRVADGTATVIYYTNGRCDPYRVRIKDEHGAGIAIEVDALSTAKTEQEP